MNAQLFPKMCDSGEPFNRRLHNNNRAVGVLPDGDANANAIQQEDDRRTGDTSGVLQGRVTVWAPDSQCDDPELAEFEMLECQELETYLVEDGEDYVGVKDRKDAEAEERRAAKKASPQGAVERESSTEESRTDVHSEADVFLSCVSTISTVDNVMDASVRAQRADGGPGPGAGPCHSSGKSTTQQKSVDVNSNSTVPSDDCSRNNNQSNGAALDSNRERGGEHRAAEGGAKKNQSTLADEAAAEHGSPHKSSTRDSRKQRSFHDTLTKQNSFDGSFRKQPSFETALKKQGSFEIAGGLERRRPWGSPVRPATPTSPRKASSSSPMRRPPGSPARGRGLSSERGESPQRSFGSAPKPPAKAGSGIPKPVVPQQKESEAARSSPPQRAKNVRPKIITYVRKTPPARPQGTDELAASSHPSPKAQKDHRVGSQLKSQDRDSGQRQRQEAQKTDVSGTRPSGSSGPQRLGRKSGSFHEDAPEKSLQEVRNWTWTDTSVSAFICECWCLLECLLFVSLPQPVGQDGGGGYRPARTLRPQLGLGAVTRQPAAKARLQQAGQRSTASPSQPGPAQNCPDPTGETSFVNQSPVCFFWFFF